MDMGGDGVEIRRRKDVDLTRDQQEVGEQLPGALVEGGRAGQLHAAQRAEAQELGRGRLLAGKLQPRDVGAARQAQRGGRHLRQRRVDVLPGRVLTQHPPEERAGVDAARVAPAPSAQRVEAVVVGVGRFRGHPGSVPQLAADLLGEPGPELGPIDDPHFHEHFPMELRARDLELGKLGQRLVQLLLVDVTELVQHLTEIGHRLTGPDLGRFTLGEEHHHVAFVRGEDLHRPGQLLVHRVEQQMEERRLGERSARGRRWSVGGRVAHDGRGKKECRLVAHF
jgi:hypothetical protein